MDMPEIRCVFCQKLIAKQATGIVETSTNLNQNDTPAMQYRCVRCKRTIYYTFKKVGEKN